jgi:hypothetical protein
LFALIIVGKHYEKKAIQSLKDKEDAIQPTVKIAERKLLVDFDKDRKYSEFFIKGVIYNPTPIGRHPEDIGWPEFYGRSNNMFDDDELLHRDFALLKEMNCNTVRIINGNDRHDRHGKFPDRLTTKALDIADSYGIKVIAGFQINTLPPKCDNSKIKYTTPDFTNPRTRESIINSFAKYVSTFKDHPAILFWAIGNGNNSDIDQLDTMQINAWYSLVDEMAQKAHAIEGKTYHPVALVSNEIEDLDDSFKNSTDNDLKNVDIFGINSFRGKSFGDLFTNFAIKTRKPLWISEYGIDSFLSADYLNNFYGEEDQEFQAEWIGNLWDEIANNKDITIGGTVKEYSDEWWQSNPDPKDEKLNSSHDLGGTSPDDKNCDGELDWFPEAPDKFFHDEWWGIVSIEDAGTDIDVLNPKKTYYTLQQKFSEQ